MVSHPSLSTSLTDRNSGIAYICENVLFTGIHLAKILLIRIYANTDAVLKLKNAILRLHFWLNQTLF